MADAIKTGAMWLTAAGGLVHLANGLNLGNPLSILSPMWAMIVMISAGVGTAYYLWA